MQFGRRNTTREAATNPYNSPQSANESGARRDEVAQRFFCLFLLFLGTPMIGHIAMLGILGDFYLGLPIPFIRTSTFSMANASVATMLIMSHFDLFAGAFYFANPNRHGPKDALKLGLFAIPSRVLAGPFVIYWSSLWLVAFAFVAVSIVAMLGSVSAGRKVANWLRTFD